MKFNWPSPDGSVLSVKSRGRSGTGNAPRMELLVVIQLRGFWLRVNLLPLSWTRAGAAFSFATVFLEVGASAFALVVFAFFDSGRGFESAEWKGGSAMFSVERV